MMASPKFVREMVFEILAVINIDKKRLNITPTSFLQVHSSIRNKSLITLKENISSDIKGINCSVFTLIISISVSTFAFYLKIKIRKSY